MDSDVDDCEFVFSPASTVAHTQRPQYRPDSSSTFPGNTDLDFPRAYDGGPNTASTLEPSFGLLSPLRLTKRYTKLEVVNARQVERILTMQYAIIAAGLFYTALLILLCYTAFYYFFETRKDEGWEYDLRGYVISDGFWAFHIALRFVFFFVALCLALIFGIRIFTQSSKNITHEQVWVVALLASASVYLLPIQAVVELHDHFLPVKQLWVPTDTWKNKIHPLSQVLSTCGFSGTTIFYVWACMHSYRFLESNISIRFYIVKIVPILVYIIGRVVITYRPNHYIFLAELPFTNLTGMLSLYYTADQWDLVGMCCAIAVTFADFFFVICILYERRRTKMVLKKADYHKYRSKQVGFRFFMYHNITFYSIFISSYIVLQLSLPNAGPVVMYRVPKHRYSIFQTHYTMNIGFQLMLLAYCWTEAYVNLPADALGFRGWFRAQSPPGYDAKMSELEPITYRKREPPSMHGVVSDVNINCFIMQTHVTMFNFAWLVYYWDTRKVENFKITQDVFKFSIVDYIKDKLTDTHALVVDGEDRIVVAFKGTTSLKNLKTDLKMFHTPLRGLLPTPLPDFEEDMPPAAEEIIGTRLWRKAQIHQGFATAYRAIAPQLLKTVTELQEKRRRPVFITGHSLGGALATVCSIDLLVTLGLSRREIFVSTFGAPRVGNLAFRELYDTGVPIHWRMVVGPDVVAKLPKLGYRHCGKKVLITVDGDLFMDPNSLELNLWSGDTASILYHRKASYLLAMRAWCMKHHGDEYVPEFWPFPVSTDDRKLFEHVQNKHEGAFGYHSKSVSQRRARLREFEQLIDKMVDVPNLEARNERSVRNWEKLTRKLLAQTTQTENANDFNYS